MIVWFVQIAVLPAMKDNVDQSLATFRRVRSTAEVLENVSAPASPACGSMMRQNRLKLNFYSGLGPGEFLKMEMRPATGFSRITFETGRGRV
jgi:hypothetical protein